MNKRMKRLMELGSKTAWTAKRWEPLNQAKGSTESVGLVFSLLLPSGRSFEFSVFFARRETTGRWNALTDADGYRVTGTLVPGDGSPRDQLAELYGAPLESRSWKSIENLEYWLQHPKGVCSFEWVDEGGDA